jgi:hypothetical protein
MQFQIPERVRGVGLTRSASSSESRYVIVCELLFNGILPGGRDLNDGDQKAVVARLLKIRDGCPVLFEMLRGYIKSADWVVRAVESRGSRNARAARMRGS